MVGVCEGGLDCIPVAVFPIEADVIRCCLMQQGRSHFIGAGRMGGNRQLLVVDRHEIGRIPGCIEVFSDDGGDRIAHMADLVDREKGMGR